MSAGQSQFAVDETFDGVGLLQVKFQAQGRVEKARGLWQKFVQNWPASDLVFNILPGNYDASSNTTPSLCLPCLQIETYHPISNK